MKKSIHLYYEPAELSTGAQVILKTLQEEYPVSPANGFCNICFRYSGDEKTLAVARSGEKWVVSYGREYMISRGVALAFAGIETVEKNPFSSCGILLDCTRGNIMTVSAFKVWVRKLAMMGCNRVMLYVKDAYQLPDEPYFGYMRGAYSQEEIREMDCYAQKLGVELSAAIQVMGHLEPIMRWPVYQKIRDTSSAIMIDEPASYHLIEKMLVFWSNALSSRNIHIGMDETFDLGRGRFMDINGYENSLEIFKRHLQRVTLMCRKMGLKPMIWADMFFRYANKNQEYYDTASGLDAKGIPDDVELSYWDYYHRDTETYEKMLLRTKALNGRIPMMASGIWTWLRMWTDFEMTRATILPCLEACERTGVQELIFTMWGDDGAYCDFNSSWASLLWALEQVYSGKENELQTFALFEVITGTSWHLQKQCGNLCYTVQKSDGSIAKISADAILWDDPLLGITCNEFPAIAPDLMEKLIENYQQLREYTAPYRHDNCAGSIGYAWNIADAVTRKLQIRKRLCEAYRSGDIAGLKELCSADIPELLSSLEELQKEFRKQWLRNFKHFGLEINQIRIAGIAERYRELQRVLDEFIRGESTTIPALDNRLKPAALTGFHYRHIATGNFFI